MIKILHLYYDLMNLYGEIGNIKFLENSLKSMGIKVVIDKLTINDNITINDYDFIYIGSGTEENINIVLKDILKYKDDIKKYIDDNKYIYASGNSIELFGKDMCGNKSLNIFDYSSIYTDKLVGDVLYTIPNIKMKVLGFQNRYTTIINNNYPLYKEDNSYGVHYKNFIGSYVFGPLLIRNPELSTYILKDLVKSKKLKYKKLDLSIETKAYYKYLENYYKSN